MSEPIGEPTQPGKSKEERVAIIRDHYQQGRSGPFLRSIVKLFEDFEYDLESMQDFLIGFDVPFLEKIDRNDFNALNRESALIGSGVFHTLAQHTKTKEDIMEFLRTMRSMVVGARRQERLGKNDPDDDFLHGDLDF